MGMCQITDDVKKNVGMKIQRITHYFVLNSRVPGF